MARPDGRIEPGQRAANAFSARAWNRAQDAADIVLGARPGLAAGDLGVDGFPALKVPCLFLVGAFTGSATYGTAATVGTVSSSASLSGSDLLPSPTVPITSVIDETFSDAEKLLPARSAIEVQQTAASSDNNFNGSRVAICCESPNIFVISGFAITRIRVFSTTHRYARPPVPCSLNDEHAAGCLDSCQFSSVRIIGYMRPEPNRYGFYTTTLTYPNHEYRWALVYL